MHPAPIFSWDDRSGMLSFVAERSFATLAATIEGRIVVAHAPMIVDGDRCLLHLSRANPLGRAMPVRVTAIVHGPDAYVSPDWYAASDQVPTWNYVAVEIEGELAPIDDQALRAIVDQLSAEHEGRIDGKPPWTSEKMTPEVLSAKLRGIVGATLSIDVLRGTRKLSQNKDATDQAGVIAALAGGPDAGARAIAALMSQGRPTT